MVEKFLNDTWCNLKGRWVILAMALMLMASPKVDAADVVQTTVPAWQLNGSSVYLAQNKKRRRNKRYKRNKKRGTRARTKKSKPAQPKVPVVAKLPPPPEFTTDKRVIAVLPLASIDIGDDMTHAIAVAIEREIEETEGLQAVSPTDVLNDLNRYGLTSSCDGALDCLAQAGRYARAHATLEIRVAAIGGTINLSMRLIDVASKEEVHRVAATVSEDPVERAQEMHRLAVQLLKPATYIGTLSILCQESGTSVFVDDKLVGTTPLEGPLVGLTAGPHILRMSKPGFSDLYRFVDVIYKRTSTIEIDLTNNTIAGTIVAQESATGFGSLYVNTDLTGIEIRIDGEPRGNTPLLAPIEKVAAGSHKVSLRKEGLDPTAREVMIVAGMRVDIAAFMQNGALFLQPKGDAVDASLPLPVFSEAIMATTQTDAMVQLAPQNMEPSYRAGWRFYGGLTVAGFGVLGIVGSNIMSAQVRNWVSVRNNISETWTHCIVNDGTLEQAKRASGNPCSVDPDTTQSEQRSRDEQIEDLSDHLQKRKERADSAGSDATMLQFALLGTGAGLIAIGGGLILWDLLRDNPETQSGTGNNPNPVAWRFGVVPSQHGAWFHLGASF